MKNIKVLSTTAILGYGFPEESFLMGMKQKPDVIAVDAGSTDPGPYYLGSGKCFVNESNVERDLDYMISFGVKEKIPVIIGTAGGSGAQSHVEQSLDIIYRIVNKYDLDVKIAVIFSDIHHNFVKQALIDNKVKSLEFVPELTEDAINQSTHIVAQMGVEPIIEALKKDVNIILCGRCYDPAVFAALPIARGFDPGLAIHMGKILECAAIAATPGSGRECVLGIIEEGAFTLIPLSNIRKFTTESVSAHTLYEKSNPIKLPGPGGYLDLTHTTFIQKTEEQVEVRGSVFIKSDVYTVKLEAAKPVGYRTIAICGVRDNIMLKQIDSILDNVKKVTLEDYDPRQVNLIFRVYGKNGVMGVHEPLNEIAHEAGIVIEAIAQTQQEANKLCGYARSTLLHYGYSERISTAGNLAIPFSPSDIPAGQVFEFSMNHVLDVKNGLDMFPIKVVHMVKGKCEWQK